MIPYGRQFVDEDDVAAVVEVLRSDWLTTGPAVTTFEDGLREVTGARFAVAFANGTAALHGAAWAAGFSPGDQVATSALTFSASAACARFVGATPVLLDIDPATLNLDATSIPVGLEGLVAVHYAGLPVDLARLSHRPRVLIEDAAHALGAMTPDGPVGACARSDMTCFSFHPVKPVTTAEGGAVTTNDPELDARLRRFRNHGIEPTPDRGAWSYEIRELGYNYRLTDLQAALGSSQLRKLDAFLQRRTELAERYRARLSHLPVTLPPVAPAGWRHGYHLFAVRVPERRRVFEGLRERGIGVQVHYVPLHHHPAYADLGLAPGDLPGVEEAYAGLLSLPLYPGLTDAQQDTVVDALEELL